MLDENAKRKPVFAEGVPIVLGDGQAWHFPKPRLHEFRPSFGPDGSAKIGAGSIRTHGPGYLARLDALMASSGGIGQIEMAAGLAAELLLKNYDLDGEQLGELLSYVVDEEGNMDDPTRERWQAIANHAAGISGNAVGVAG